MRDVYDITLPSGEPALLIVATDRISAFDYVLGSGIPDKGKVLTQLSAFWFERMGDLVPHHLISTRRRRVPRRGAPSRATSCAAARCLRGAREPLPIECVARGYLSGSGWKEYQQTGSVCGVKLPAGLRESDRLPEPIFTPATKAETRPRREHQRRRSRTARRPPTSSSRLKTLTLEIYRRGCEHAESKGIIIADTKFEFGLVGAGNPATDVVLIDEVLTPDSSRFWPQDRVRAGHGQPSFDKQFVRDYLEEITLEQAAAGAVAARRGRRGARARSTSKRSACCPDASSR